MNKIYSNRAIVILTTVMVLWLGIILLSYGFAYLLSLFVGLGWLAVAIPVIADTYIVSSVIFYIYLIGGLIFG